MTDILTFHPENSLDVCGLRQKDLEAVRPAVEAARETVLGEDLDLYRGGGEIPPSKKPLDAGFLELPERLLKEFREDPQGSELGRIQAAAQRMAQEVDRVVLVGIGGSYMGARSIFEACCHPFHNELSRDRRSSRPKISFAGYNVDNDSTRGLLDILQGSSGHDHDWGLVVVSKSGGTLEPALATQTLLEALGERHRDDQSIAMRRFIPITGRQGKLRDIATSFGCESVFDVPDGVGGRFSVLSAVGLLPAALMGLDVEAMLQGAADMNQHFREGSFSRNAVLDFVALAHLLETKALATTRILSVWGQRLECFGLWYDQLLSESLGKEQKGATPITAVNTRDLHSRGQQHQEGRRDKMITNIIVEQGQMEPLRLDFPLANGKVVTRSLDEVLGAAALGTNRAYRQDARPTCDIRLKELNEHSLGQLFQMMMLATVLEGRLIGINPYGQPGVEGYKNELQRILDQGTSSQ